jgi:hypothetical protein
MAVVTVINRAETSMVLLIRVERASPNLYSVRAHNITTTKRRRRRRRSSSSSSKTRTKRPTSLVPLPQQYSNQLEQRSSKQENDMKIIPSSQ